MVKSEGITPSPPAIMEAKAGPKIFECSAPLRTVSFDPLASEAQPATAPSAEEKRTIGPIWANLPSTSPPCASRATPG